MNYLIIGASSGIGETLAKQLLAQGHQVYSASRNQPNIANVNHITLDISNSFEAQILTNFLPETLHGVAYCAGSINLKPFHRLTEQDFLQDFQVNVMGAIRVLQAVFANLKKAETSSIVLFGTVASTLGMTFHASVGVAKSGIEGLAKSLSAEWAVHKIRVNVINPSLTDTPLANKLLNSPEKKEASGKRHPLGRVGEAEDVAQMAEFLLSEKSTWITGQVIGVDGGMGSLKP
jgi:3-oxoacyl-[acyl-carrier protein] reductase